MLNLVSILADVDTASICSDDLNQLWHVLGVAFKFLLVGIPVILVIMGLIDLGKAVMAGKDDEIKAAQKMLIKRILYTVVAFLLLVIVIGVINLVDTTDSKGVTECLKKIFGSTD